MTTDDTILSIPSEDFTRLKSAVQTLDRKLILEAEETEDGDDYISVSTKDRFHGPTRLEGQVVAHVIHTEAGWAVEGPLGGCYEFDALSAVAAFLACGDDE